jgi:hypothetical protein
MMMGVSKMLYQTTAKLVFLAALLTSAGACSKTNGGSLSAGESQTVKPRTVKSGAALEFSHRMQTPIRANASHSVTIIMSHSYAGQSAVITASADSSLKLAAKEIIMPLVKGQKATWTIPFTASVDGLYYINIIAKVTGADGNMQARAYAVRVEVGQQVQSKKPTPREIILPAEEKISR